jgi:hypothetical protein
MKLPQRPLLQMLLGSSNVMALGKISDNLFAHPASIEDSCLGIGETPLHVWDKAAVRGLLAEVVRVLEIQRLVCSSYDTMRRSTAEQKGMDSPKIGPPFPFAAIGSPCRNSAARLTNAGAALVVVADQRRQTAARVPANLMIGRREKRCRP